MLKLLLPAAALTLAVGATAASDERAANRQLALQGKAVAEPISCITTREIEDTNAISDKVVLFHLKNGRTYRNDLPNSCPQITRSGSSLAYVSMGRLCAVDVVQVSEPSSGFAYGGCQLGKFTRYELPEGLNPRSF
jgi:hypothetical protein